MVELNDDAVDGPRGPRRQPSGPRRRGSPSSERPVGPRPTRPGRRDLGSDIGPFLFLLAAVAPLAGALFRIVDLLGAEGLTATRAVGPRLQLLGNAVNPLTGLLLVAAVVVAVIARSTHAALVAGIAVAIATLMTAVGAAVVVAAVRDPRIFPRANDAHVEVISYEVGSVLVALGVVWLALRVLRRTDAS